MSKTAEERAYNYASTQKPTKLQVGEIAKHYNNGYDQAMKDFLEKAIEWLEPVFKDLAGYNCGGDLINVFKQAMKEE